MDNPFAALKGLTEENDLILADPWSNTLQYQMPPLLARDYTNPFLDMGSMDHNMSFTPPIEKEKSKRLDKAPELHGDIVSNFHGLYSTSGIDMIGILARVANRPNPQINIGPVDFSASILVVDARRYDWPIVYASPSFEELSGYTNKEILGRNARFMQAPDGRVMLGSRRRHTDNDAVQSMKEKLMSGKECQVSLLNYRKGGNPFFNLVSFVPIMIESEEVSFFVGFCADMIQQSNAVLENMRQGTYMSDPRMITGSSHIMPAPIAAPPMSTAMYQPQAPVMREVRDYPSNMPFTASPEVLGLIPDFKGDAKTAMHNWHQMLLEHADDFIHIISFKGVFVYCSPSVKNLLGYGASELVGQNISTICHPRDIIGVMRELKESEPTRIKFVYRIRRKDSAYIFLEVSGKIHHVESKGPKRFLLTGRRISTYNVPNREIYAAGGVTEDEFWAKLSLDGLILHVSSTCKDLIGYDPEDLMGLSVYDLIQPNHTTEITQAINKAKKGETNHVNHVIQGKEGKEVKVETTLYAGNYAANGKVAFLVLQVREPQTTKPSVSSSSSETNFFGELEAGHDSFWRYEIHRMRLENAKMSAAIQAKEDGEETQEPEE